MAKQVEQKDVTIAQEFSISEKTKAGIRSKILKVGDHVTVSDLEASQWCKRGLAVEGKIKLPKAKE